MKTNIRILAYFLENGEEAACNHFMISSLELIQAIQTLEEDLHTQLISHIHFNNIKPTRYCLTLLPSIQKSLDILEGSVASGSNKSNPYDFDNELTLGLASDSASTWAMECIKNFNKMHPGLRLTILADNYITKAMISEATIIFWCLEDGELLEFKRHWYIEYTYGLFASEEYITKNGEPSIENIRQHRIIAYSGPDSSFDYRGSNWHLSGKYGLPCIKPAIYASSREMVSRLVSDGAGIGSVCDSQDIYYGLKGLRKVLPYIDGPSIRSYFASKKGVSEQISCNIELLDNLFRNNFKKKKVTIVENDL